MTCLRSSETASTQHLEPLSIASHLVRNTDSDVKSSACVCKHEAPRTTTCCTIDRKWRVCSARDTEPPVSDLQSSKTLIIYWSSNAVLNRRYAQACGHGSTTIDDTNLEAIMPESNILIHQSATAPLWQQPFSQAGADGLCKLQMAHQSLTNRDRLCAWYEGRRTSPAALRGRAQVI